MKVGFLITARLKSKRLPFKIIKDLNGKTVLERVIDRAKNVKDISEVILCTSTNPQDKPLIDIAKNNSIYYFAGDEEDVLKRLFDASKLFSLDYFVSITADNPLMDIYYSNLLINDIKTGKYDFIKLEGLPLGSAAYGMRVKALETVCEIKKIKDTEIWGYFIRPEIFEIKTINVTGKLKRPELRFTVDYEEDYELIRNIYNNVHSKNVLNLYDIIDYLDENPEIAQINQNCAQMDLDNETKKEIEREYQNNLESIKNIKKEIYKES
ncbi:cytidylyltransferase domain-containing protein [Methanobacterium paludis]|uniref:Acylneuraminate cytidylyltransferase n=1 Tax=Methanobacterium paludis (strain DSM 25820 / JCM 18151 / SWAN1) TaxID=868131 RepID=F6D707_METPW|nr:3-deoxy-manno-octulosonate cytidylyltransferase [Methanobacterium paludis]AEG18374.1 acylneuraminate cytidylyltransferase [Methanobacterium paludis]